MTAKRRTTILGFGALVAVLYALWRLLETRRQESGVGWEPQPFPMPPRPVPTPSAPEAEPPAPTGSPTGATEAWVEPVDGTCPASHPVKGKRSSGIFHAPGGQMYDRTRADRCYADADAAVADGLRPSKR
jgi:hypothetical protein